MSRDGAWKQNHKKYQIEIVMLKCLVTVLDNVSLHSTHSALTQCYNASHIFYICLIICLISINS